MCQHKYYHTMTLTKLTIGVAMAALLFTVLIAVLAKKRMKNPLISYLQCFTGALFVFSGWVKAIDPLGTAYKMEQYFAEFETTFEGTWFSFLSPLFPVLSKYAIGFSVGVIVFEILLGIMLLLGAYKKLTAWAFFLLVAFFTFLTGYTYLTGYVPSEPVAVIQHTNGESKQLLLSGLDTLSTEGWSPIDTVKVNFFDFGYWQAYKETNMKVTDCGCFGDFLKLKPKTSFLKDIFLLIPALLFLFFASKMHQLFSPTIRGSVLVLSTAGLIVYCLSNYVWDLPHIDFRPFKKGVNVVERKEYEAEATLTKVIGYELTNKSTGEKVNLTMEQLGEMVKYPKEIWEYEQIRSIPEAEPTKISDFAVENYQGYEVTDDILYDEGYSLMIVGYNLVYESVKTKIITVLDTIWAMDSLMVNDSLVLTQRIESIEKRQIERRDYFWNEDYTKRWTEVVNPLALEAEKAGVKIYAISKPYDESAVNDFRHTTQSAYPFYKADDILLKTIIRSNPGVLLWHNGTIVNKWHWRKMPSFQELQPLLMPVDTTTVQ